MKNDFTTAPLAPGLRGAGGGTVEKSFTASHTKIQTRPLDPLIPVSDPIMDAPEPKRPGWQDW